MIIIKYYILLYHYIRSTLDYNIQNIFKSKLKEIIYWTILLVFCCCSFYSFEASTAFLMFFKSLINIQRSLKRGPIIIWKII